MIDPRLVRMRYRAWRAIPAEDRLCGKRVPRRTALRHALGWHWLSVFDTPKEARSNV